MIEQKRLVYIDDDHDDLIIFGEALKEAAGDTVVLTAKNADEGIQLVRSLSADGKGLPCGIIVDLNMPKTDGKQVVEILRSNLDYAEIPIIVFSTSSSRFDKAFCSERNIPCITKPMSYDDLNETISELLKCCSC